MEADQLIPHLFRTEFSKICAVLNTYFHFRDVQLAEDMASAAFQAALETWPYKGVPDNPVAWLYQVARNRAINYLKQARRNGHAGLEELSTAEAPDLTEPNIQDSLLTTLFTICDPVLPSETQIGLALRILCGFGIDEIASAFMVSKEVINKRLYRGREKLRTSGLTNQKGDLKDDRRLDNVLLVLYLLFNEGYHSETHSSEVRSSLCHEAIRLTSLLLNDQATAQPRVHALFALMNFQASRLDARSDPNGHEVLYEEQDEQLWDQEMITTGAYHLHKAAKGDLVTAYHLEAMIAYWHTQRADTPDKWLHILRTYDQLLQIQYSPVAALNRMLAYGKVHGAAAAIEEAGKLGQGQNPYYHVLMGKLFEQTDPGSAIIHYLEAKARFLRLEEKDRMDAKLSRLLRQGLAN